MPMDIALKMFYVFQIIVYYDNINKKKTNGRKPIRRDYLSFNFDASSTYLIVYFKSCEKLCES
jgi:hypothetical protein